MNDDELMRYAILAVLRNAERPLEPEEIRRRVEEVLGRASSAGVVRRRRVGRKSRPRTQRDAALTH